DHEGGQGGAGSRRPLRSGRAHGYGPRPEDGFPPVHRHGGASDWSAVLAEVPTMTGAQWVACVRWEALVDFVWSGRLPRRGVMRKCRLLLCALARRDWALLDDAHRGAVETAERYADGATAYRELIRARPRLAGPFGSSTDRRIASATAAPT